ncbi:MAG: methyltransferase domain-containing protein [Usitatibacter sp.]
MHAPEGWVNYDASPGVLLGRFPKNVKYGDIVRGLPVKDVDAIYCSHILEHLSLVGFQKALRNTYHYLKPGGAFRLVVPDLRRIAEEYMKNGDSYEFMRQSGLGLRIRSRLRQAFGNSMHLWMWDEASMRQELHGVGFVNIRRAVFGDNPLFADCEERLRVDGCLAMEAEKP